MAANAGCGSAFESIPNVAGSAFEVRVHSGQCEAGKLQVIETNSKPIVETVALLARSRKASQHMAWPGSRLIVLCVAGVTRGA